MPKNIRPSHIFNSNGWENKSWAEIEVAQNQWDLLKAQEDANNLERQKINLLQQEQEERRQEEQARRARDNAILKAQAELAQARLNEIKCEEMGLDYNLLNRFYNRLVGDKLATENQIKELKQELKEAKNDLKEEELDLEVVTKIEEIKKQIEYERTHHPFKYLFITAPKLQSEINKVARKWGEDIKVKLYDKDLYNEIKDETPAIVERLKNKIKDIETQIKSKENLNYSSCEKLIKEFNEFRLSHYNIEFESYFLEVFKTDLGLDTSKVTGNGTIKDYEEYMKKVLK